MAKVNTRKRGSRWEYRFEVASIGGKRKQNTKEVDLEQKKKL